jgi:cytochrome c oxidase assembly protein Cox11
MKAYNQKNKSKQVKEHVLWATGDEIIIDTVCWCIGTIVLFVGLSYLTVPLYRIFCETNSFGGIAQTAKDFEKIAKMRAVRDRVIKVKFASVRQLFCLFLFQ